VLVIEDSFQSGRPDLNRRPLAPQASALIQAALRPDPSPGQTALGSAVYTGRVT
jgi:hypothetical protein